MSETYQLPKHNQRSVAWLRFFVGAALIVVLFMSAIMATRQPPSFGIHTLVLERNIDTGALYQTDIEEFAVAEQWMRTHLGEN